MTNGPYFIGQEPDECGHYYPDILSIGNIKRGDDIIRIIDCKYCGRTERKLDLSIYDLKNLEKNIGKLLSEEDIIEIRKRELERLLKEK